MVKDIEMKAFSASGFKPSISTEQDESAFFESANLVLAAFVIFCVVVMMNHTQQSQPLADQEIEISAETATAISSVQLTQILAERIKEKRFKQHIEIAGATISINSALLFSEGETNLSRASAAVLKALFEDLPKDSALTLSLIPRSNTEEEFLFGMSQDRFIEDRKNVLANEIKEINPHLIMTISFR